MSFILVGTNFYYCDSIDDVSFLWDEGSRVFEFFATMVDGTFTMKDVLKILVAVAAGKTSITDLGGGAATVTFRDLSDTEDRVIADMADSERTNVTLDL